MPDKLSPEQRHRNMAAIRAQNTKPELVVRKFLWSHGYRYRLNYSKLPGKPDIVMHKYRVCIFINGCFWHGHDGCKYYKVPKSNTEFWVNKVARNRQRDELVRQKLETMGWHCITIWECELKSKNKEATLETLLCTLGKIVLRKQCKWKYEMEEEESLMVAAENSAIEYGNY